MRLAHFWTHFCLCYTQTGRLSTKPEATLEDYYKRLLKMTVLESNTNQLVKRSKKLDFVLTTPPTPPLSNHHRLYQEHTNESVNRTQQGFLWHNKSLISPIWLQSPAINYTSGERVKEWLEHHGLTLMVLLAGLLYPH